MGYGIRQMWIEFWLGSMGGYETLGNLLKCLCISVSSSVKWFSKWYLFHKVVMKSI